MVISTFLHPTIKIKQVEKFLGKKRRIYKEIELIYLPFRIYTFHVTLKRLGLKSKKLKMNILLNGVNGQFALIDLDFNELKDGTPESRIQSFQVDLDECDKRSRKEMLFHLMKRYFLVFEPLITLQKVVDAYYPFWKYSKTEAINGRNLIIESVKDNYNNYPRIEIVDESGRIPDGNSNQL